MSTATTDSRTVPLSALNVPEVTQARVSESMTNEEPAVNGVPMNSDRREEGGSLEGMAGTAVGDLMVIVLERSFVFQRKNK